MFLAEPFEGSLMPYGFVIQGSSSRFLGGLRKP
jgi:hypothetical protein